MNNTANIAWEKRPGLIAKLAQATSGALIVSIPNIACFMPEYMHICTSECRAIHVGFFILRLIVFTVVIMLCLTLSANASTTQTTKRNLAISATGYVIFLPLSIYASRYICTDARGSVLVLQFLFAFMLSTFLCMTNRKRRTTEESSIATSPNPEKIGYILVNHSDKIYPIAVDAIAYIYTTGRRTLITTTDGPAYEYSQSLDSIMSRLDDSLFYRANKQFILSRNAISELTVWFDSRLLVRLKGIEPPEPIYVSKNKASQFKKWVALGTK